MRDFITQVISRACFAKLWAPRLQTSDPYVPRKSCLETNCGSLFHRKGTHHEAILSRREDPCLKSGWRPAEQAVCPQHLWSCARIERSPSVGVHAVCAAKRQCINALEVEEDFAGGVFCALP